jgi:hypothetical protein
MTNTDIQNRLIEYEGIIRMLTAKVEELVAANTLLRSEKSDALSFLTEVFNDPNALPAHRLKAAGLVLPHQVPRLESVPPPMDLVAEEVVPLAELVEKQRARADRMMREAPEFRALAKYQASLHRIGGNGNGDDSDDAS